MKTKTYCNLKKTLVLSFLQEMCPCGESIWLKGFCKMTSNQKEIWSPNLAAG